MNGLLLITISQTNCHKSFQLHDCVPTVNGTFLATRKRLKFTNERVWNDGNTIKMKRAGWVWLRKVVEVAGGALGSIKDVTLSNKLIRVVYVLGPEWSEMRKCNVEPRFSLPIIVDDSSLLRGFQAWFGVIAQAQHMPLRRDWMHVPIECYQCRWQCPKSPQCQIQLQILPTQQTIIGTQ
jgi:hypothetical protein